MLSKTKFAVFSPGWATGRIVLSSAVALGCLAGAAMGQTLRFSTREEVSIPDYATLRIGPFYSSVAFSQTAGYRYTKSSGAGTDFLFRTGRGRIKKDGSDWPLISELTFRNYLLISRYMDLDVSFTAAYEYYPMDTQEDRFYIDIVEEGIEATISMDYTVTPFIKGDVYDAFRYTTDYIDERGISDIYGGSEYEYLRNEIGNRLDWLIHKDGNVSFDLSRTDNIPREDKFEDQERVTYREDISYSRKLTPSILVGAGASFSQFDYQSTNRSDTSYQEYNVFGSARLTQRTKANASAGYSLVSVSDRNRDEDEDSNSGTYVGAVSLETQLSKSLAHSFGYSRSQSAGFATAYDITDTYFYNLKWQGALASASLSSRLSDVEPSSSAFNDYWDWANTLEVKYPLTRIITLLGSAVYNVRNNQALEEDSFADGIDSVTGREDAATTLDEEYRDDYETWSAKLGTSFAITRSVSFETYYRHVERLSDSEDLAYERDTFVANLVYQHEF